MRDRGLMENRMVTVNTLMQMVQNILGPGLMTNNMGMGPSTCRMVRCTKGTSTKE
jgi:hypothetical protein